MIKFLKNNKHLFIIIFIMLLGLLFRLVNIEKPEGMWFDEYKTYNISSLPFSAFLDKVFNLSHAPLFYFCLHFWIKLFGTTDLAMRFLPLLFGMATIWVFYLIGKELDSKPVGLLASAFLAVNTFAIYFSQEIRVYSLIILFSALSMLFALKIMKNPTKTNFFALILANLGILYTHTIGFVFIFFQVLSLYLYFFKEKKKALKSYTIANIITFLAFLPFVSNLFRIMNKPGVGTISQFWSEFYWAKLFFMISDYFSPVVINLVNSPNSYLYLITHNPLFIIYTLIPSLICIIGLINAFFKDKKIKYFYIMLIGFIVVLTTAALKGKMIFITKYTCEIFPILSICSIFGLMKLKNRKIAVSLLVFLFLIHSYYLIASPFSAHKKPKLEGHKLVGDMLNKANLGSNDMILSLFYATDYFDKYFDTSHMKTLSITRGSFYKMVSNNEFDRKKIFKNPYKNLKPYLKSSESTFFEQSLKKQVFDKLQKGNKLAVISINHVSLYDNDQLKEILDNEGKYKKNALIFLVFSKLKNDTIDICSKRLKPLYKVKNGSWEIFVFEK